MWVCFQMNHETEFSCGARWRTKTKINCAFINVIIRYIGAYLRFYFFFIHFFEYNFSLSLRTTFLFFFIHLHENKKQFCFVTDFFLCSFISIARFRSYSELVKSWSMYVPMYNFYILYASLFHIHSIILFCLPRFFFYIFFLRIMQCYFITQFFFFYFCSAKTQLFGYSVCPWMNAKEWKQWVSHFLLLLLFIFILFWKTK